MNNRKFSNGELYKNVQTVGEMIDELSRLPRSLRICQGMSQSADLVVYNSLFGLDDPDCQLCVEEGGMIDEEVDIEY